MATLRWPALALVLSAVLCARPALADNDAEGKRHFRAGVALYQGGNYNGALAEFQASHQLRPAASALQNVALCQKALFRYVEAIETLEALLRDYGEKLPPAEKKAVRDAIEEMRPRVASVLVSVSPPGAALTVDGRTVPGGAERRVQLDVGEHVFEAEAPGHRPFAKRIAFAAADRRIDVALTPELGTVTVRADDEAAAIAVDGVARGYGTWTGPVAAGVRHTVVVYRPGRQTVTLEALVGPGEKQELKAHLAADGAAAAAPPPVYGAPPDKAPPASRTGPYGYLMASTYLVTGHPDGFAVPEGDNVTLDGAYFGLRLGYRLTDLFGLEGSFEAGRHDVGPGCYGRDVTTLNDCTEERSNNENEPTYTLIGQRFGANGRFFFPTKPFGIVGALGLGVVRHRFRIGQSLDAPAPLTAVDDSGLNGYVMIEGGAEFTIRRVLIDVVLTGVGEGVTNLGGENNQRQAYKRSPNIGMVGLGLRVGYGLF